MQNQLPSLWIKTRCVRGTARYCGVFAVVRPSQVVKGEVQPDTVLKPVSTLPAEVAPLKVNVMPQTTTACPAMLGPGPAWLQPEPLVMLAVIF